MAYSPPRKRNVYKPGSESPFKVSRSKIELFLNCPRCFYLDRCKGIDRPPGFPFNLNSAVDELLKKEFDEYRVLGQPHPLMIDSSVDAIPFSHPDLDKWRMNFTGVQYLHEPTNLLLFGAVDDVWVDPAGSLIVVDYKATSKTDEVTLDAAWQIGYKRQMEIYQWLLRRNGFEVSNTGYFVYCNGDKSKDRFDSKLEFRIKLIPYIGDTEWVQGSIMELHACLNQNDVPDAAEDCDYCRYTKSLAAL